MLLGDAAGYSEPFTGEGIGWALASAVTAVPVAINNLRRWDSHAVRQWEANQRRHQFMDKRPADCSPACYDGRSRFVSQCRALAVAPFLARPLVHRIHQSKAC